MRKMEITEIDNRCYIIETTEFDNDDVKYHWASTPGYFYAENKRTYKRHYFDWKKYTDFGVAIQEIWEVEAMRHVYQLGFG